MPATTIADLWVPAIWVKGVDEAARIFPSFITSGAVMQSPLFDEIASGGGVSANIPLFRDITDVVDGIQVEGVATPVDKIPGAVNVSPILNREKAFGVTGLAAGVTGEDVVGHILKQLGLRRQKMRHATALAILRGLFGSAGASPATGAALFSQLNDKFSETGAAAAAPNLITTAYVNATIALMGETSSSLQNGAILMHPIIHAALKTIDASSFDTMPSQQGLRIPTYQGIPVWESALLSRAGGTSGFVFETYFVGPGAMAWGEKPQIADDVGVASLQMDKQFATNTTQIFDRSRYLIHVNGTKYIGVPAGQSATNAELQVLASWQFIGSPAIVAGAGLGIPIACLRTNG